MRVRKHSFKSSCVSHFLLNTFTELAITEHAVYMYIIIALCS